MVAAGENATGWTADEAVSRLFAAHLTARSSGSPRCCSPIAAGPRRSPRTHTWSCNRRWHRLDDTRQGARLPACHGGTNRSRSALRHRRVVEQHAATSRVDETMASAEIRRRLARIGHTANPGRGRDAADPATRGPRAALLRRALGPSSGPRCAEAMGWQPRMPSRVIPPAVWLPSAPADGAIGHDERPGPFQPRRCRDGALRDAFTSVGPPPSIDIAPDALGDIPPTDRRPAPLVATVRLTYPRSSHDHHE